MESVIESKLKELKDEFKKICDLRSETVDTFKNIDDIIKEINVVYADFVKNTKESLMIFGLNPFYFQCKLIKLERDEMDTYFTAIINRMYCEYY